MIKIVQLTSNPVGGSPYELYDLLNRKSRSIESYLISGAKEYPKKENHLKRQFPYTWLWYQNKQKCKAIIQKADILHCHNSIFPDNLKELKSPNQKIILHLYSVNRKVLETKIEKVKDICDFIVIADQPWQKSVYQDISNYYLPLVKSFDFSSNISNKVPIVVYAPTNRYDENHLYSKGYHRIVPILEKLENKIKLKIIEGVPYLKNLAEKAEADIVIDDVVNDEVFHGSSLEAVCSNAVPVTNYGSDDYPFYKTNINNLLERLKSLLKRNNLKREKKRIKKWAEKNYNENILLEKYEHFYFQEVLKMERNPKDNTKEMKKAKEELFLIMSNWLDKHNIFHFLNLGTLLKSYRDGNHYSTDIDIGLFVEDRWKVKELIKTDLPSNVEVNCLWRMEFTFKPKGYKYPKLDFNFYEPISKTKMQTYLYSRSPINGHVDWERGITVSKKSLKGFTDYTFYGKTIKIPKNINTFLKDHYGDWHINKPNFCGWGNRVNANINHREFAVVINTFLRDDKLVECINSLRKYYPDELVRIYVGDQNHIEDYSEEKIKLYEELKLKGHKIYKLEYNCGLAKARNVLVSKTKEPYILIIDDDFIFTKNSDISKFRDILEERENLGVAGGKLEGRSPYLGWFCHVPQIGKILKINIFSVPYIERKTTCYNYKPRQITYYDTDIVLNFALYKREVFNDFKWDENLVLVEHSDAFLRLKETKWQVAYTPEVEIKHNDTSNSKLYNDFRRDINVNIGIERFSKKWGIKNLKDIHNIGLQSTPPPIVSKTLQPVIIEQVKNVKPSQPKKKLSKIEQVTNLLISNGIKVALMRDTCKVAILDKSFKNIGNIIYLGVSDINKAQSILIQYPNVYIEPFPVESKGWIINEQLYSIPFPVVKYLESLYGRDILRELKLKGRIS